MYTGFFYVIMRIVYMFMYGKCGSDRRHLGAIAGSLALYLLVLGTFGYTIYLIVMQMNKEEGT